MTSKKIIREPGSGKTRDLMALCAENNATLVCKNPEGMLVKSRAYGYDINIISYIDFLQTSKYNQNNAYLDDIDEFLDIIGCNILGFGGNL